MNLNTQNITGIILAGGKSRRLGRDKALEKIGDCRIVDRVISAISNVCQKIIVVGNNVDRKDQLNLGDDICFVTDLYSDKGSLGGLYSGLKASQTDWNFLFACDMPFISTTILSSMLGAEIPDGTGVVAFEVDGYIQTTHALYKKSCLPMMEQNLLSNKLRMNGYFDQVCLKKMSEELLANTPQGELSFFNVNTEEDLQRARSIYNNLSTGDL